LTLLKYPWRESENRQFSKWMGRSCNWRGWFLSGIRVESFFTLFSFNSPFYAMEPENRHRPFYSYLKNSAVAVKDSLLS